MTLLWVDGAELHDAADWYSYMSGFASWTTVKGREGINLTDVRRNLESTEEDDGITVGMRYWPSGLGQDMTPFALYEDFGTVKHLDLFFDWAGRTIKIRNGDGTVLAVTEPNMWVDNEWIYLELKAKIHDSAGTAELRVHGVSRIILTGVDTRNGGTDGLIDQVGFGGNDPGSPKMTDVYILNEQGSAPYNTFLGDCRAYAKYPNAAGAHTDLTPTGSATNWENVDEAGTPNDADYNGSETVGDTDTYETTDMPQTLGTIWAVDIRMRAVKSDAGVKSIRSVLRHDVTDATGDDQTLSTTPLNYHQLYALDPITGVGWTIPDVNEPLEIGAEVRP